MRMIRVLTVLLVAMAFSTPAFAGGPGGIFAKRGLTQNAGSLKVIAGPKAPQLLGGGGDAGFQLIRTPEIDLGIATIEAQNIMDLNFGTVYGINDNIEAGAMLNLGLAPEGRDTFGNPTVFATYGMAMGNTDIGGRVALNIPVTEGSDPALNVGVPVLHHAGNVRLDTGLFAPIALGDDMVVNLNIPVRVAFQAMPKLFVGAETGVNLGNVVGPEGSEMSAVAPLGAFVGYTMPMSGKVLDIVGSIAYDGALYLNAPEGADMANFDMPRINVGVNYQM